MKKRGLDGRILPMNDGLIQRNSVRRTAGPLAGIRKTEGHRSVRYLHNGSLTLVVNHVS